MVTVPDPGVLCPVSGLVFHLDTIINHIFSLMACAELAGVRPFEVALQADPGGGEVDEVTWERSGFKMMPRRRIVQGIDGVGYNSILPI